MLYKMGSFKWICLSTIRTRGESEDGKQGVIMNCQMGHFTRNYVHHPRCVSGNDDIYTREGEQIRRYCQ